MADKVIFQSDDDLSETNLSETLAMGNQTDYVERGLSFSADFTNDTLDIGAGHAVVEDGNQAYHLFPDQRTGLTLSASATNHVWIHHDPATDNDIQYEINTSGTAPSNPSLKIGTVDTSNDTTTELNRDPSISADDIDIDGNDLVAAGDKMGVVSFGGQDESKSTTSSSYGTALLDIRLRWDMFAPADATVVVALGANGNNNGDQLDVRLRNTTDGEDVLEETSFAASAPQVVSSTYTPTTTDGHILIRLEIRNSDNSTSVDLFDPTVTVAIQT